MTDYSQYIPDLAGMIRISDTEFRALVERAEQAERLFNAACSDLGLISEHLKLDPDDGGCDPILGAIEGLEEQNAELLVALSDCVSVMEHELGGLRVSQTELANARTAITKAKGE